MARPRQNLVSSHCWEDEHPAAAAAHRAVSAVLPHPHPQQPAHNLQHQDRVLLSTSGVGGGRDQVPGGLQQSR